MAIPPEAMPVTTGKAIALALVALAVLGAVIWLVWWARRQRARTSRDALAGQRDRLERSEAERSDQEALDRWRKHYKRD
jgi:hypothetical protein